MTESDARRAVRLAYDYACGYCGVRETDAGSELELDHFKPRSAGGTDELENLVYCCTTCNRLKGDYWVSDTLSDRRLLHPKRDHVSWHLRLESSGLFTALTETGNFHLARLRLNRPPLVALRRTRMENGRLRGKLEQSQTAQKLSQERLIALDKQIERILEDLAGFWGE